MKNINAAHPLVPILQETIHEHLTQTVNARDLHASLGSKDQFTKWITYQIGRARLVEDRDYVVLGKIPENPTGGRPATDYHLTLDAAKHVAMMSGTDKGFEVRDYFIEVEKQSKALTLPAPAVAPSLVDRQLETHKVFKSFFQTARLVGQAKMQAAQAANAATIKLTSIDVLSLMELQTPEAKPERRPRRYQTLLACEIEGNNKTYRSLARMLSIPASSVHGYIYDDVEPRREALEKMSRHYGESIAQLMAYDDSPVDDLDGFLTATELGKSLGLTGRQVNEKLCQTGLLKKVPGGWELTAKGKKHAEVESHGKKPQAGTPNLRYRWPASVAASLAKESR